MRLVGSNGQIPLDDVQRLKVYIINFITHTFLCHFELPIFKLSILMRRCVQVSYVISVKKH